MWIGGFTLVLACIAGVVLRVFRPLRPTAYSDLNPASFWWSLALMSVLVGVSTSQMGLTEATLGAAALITASLGIVGHFDMRDRFPVARKQYVPFAVVVVASIPLFLAPVLAYGVTYYWLAGGDAQDRDSDDADDVTD